MIILGLGGIKSRTRRARCSKDGELLAAVEERKVARQTATGDLPQTRSRPRSKWLA